MIAGYACRPCFSPDQSYLCSGDGEGKMFIWDWKNGRLYSRFRAHDQVVIDCKWLPHETSKETFNYYLTVVFTLVYSIQFLNFIGIQIRVDCPTTGVLTGY